MKELHIAVLAGDGIGPEVMAQALRVLHAICSHKRFSLKLSEGLVGGAAYDVHQSHFPQETLELCRSSDAILFGSVGGPLNESHLPKWQRCEANSILALRKAFTFNANLRPVKLHKSIAHLSPLKERIIERGVDMVIVRELCGDIYFGEHTTTCQNNIRLARDVAEYDERQIAAIARTAFETAYVRSRRVCSVHKANVLDTSKLWREVVQEIHREFPEITLSELLVDNCAMQIVLDPSQFDVIVTSNMFGDILSDIAAVLPGTLGVTPSASLNAQGFGLYEPSGGSAPDIAGKGIANPVAQILSVGLMLRHSFEMHPEAQALDNAIESTFEASIFTRDLAGASEKSVGTVEFTDNLLERLERELSRLS
jgi:3-isopropylmalate dehydrogenase